MEKDSGWRCSSETKVRRVLKFFWSSDRMPASSVRKRCITCGAMTIFGSNGFFSTSDFLSSEMRWR